MRKAVLACTCLVLAIPSAIAGPLRQISGIYPHLAMYNNEGECGTGAVVSWADRLWVISYGPHLPLGSSDKLYEITPDLQQMIRPESVGGTHANRMIHRELNQLIIGPYFIDTNRHVRSVPRPSKPGRLTGTARRLSDPSKRVYFATMEEGLYEVDVYTLEVTGLIRDGNKANPQHSAQKHPAAIDSTLPGCHGKGLYSGQGRVVYSNNGERGDPMKLKDTRVKAGEPSTPYLMTGYDRKSVKLSHDGKDEVEMTVEVDFGGKGWSKYMSFKVPAGKAVSHEFPDGFSAYWTRVVSSKDCNATAWFVYE